MAAFSKKALPEELVKFIYFSSCNAHVANSGRKRMLGPLNSLLQGKVTRKKSTSHFCATFLAEED